MTNSIGKMFRVTTWGESHGPAVGAVVDGCPAGLALSAEEISAELARDVPDARLGTSRREANAAQLLSGVFEGRTLGTPISILIPNSDARSQDYEALKDTPRPGHADWTWRARYGHVDWRGGGRASGRECAARLAAAAVARKLLKKAGVQVESTILELAGVPAGSRGGLDAAVARARELAQKGETTGGRVRVVGRGVPPGIGEPVFGKLSADLGQALLGIGAVKALEIGAGTMHGLLTGSEANDPIVMRDGRVTFDTNNAGGFLGGISTGMEIVLTLTVKPPSSMPLPQRTVDLATGRETEIRVGGRFDVNITPRIAVVAESMVAIVLADHLMRSGFIHPLRQEDART